MQSACQRPCRNLAGSQAYVEKYPVMPDAVSSVVFHVVPACRPVSAASSVRFLYVGLPAGRLPRAFLIRYQKCCGAGREFCFDRRYGVDE